jgi:hypothetical protein
MWHAPSLHPAADDKAPLSTIIRMVLRQVRVSASGETPKEEGRSKPDPLSFAGMYFLPIET